MRSSLRLEKLVSNMEISSVGRPCPRCAAAGEAPAVRVMSRVMSHDYEWWVMMNDCLCRSPPPPPMMAAPERAAGVACSKLLRGSKYYSLLARLALRRFVGADGFDAQKYRPKKMHAWCEH